MMIVWTAANGATEACMITPPVLTASAEKVTWAFPPIVLAEEAESVPAGVPRDVIAKFTCVPSDTGLFKTFSTVAVMFVVWLLVRFELATLRLMVAGLLVIKRLACTGARAPTVAVTVTVPEEAPE
jgi:hypothetical protein